jgi:hypothetical protein
VIYEPQTAAINDIDSAGQKMVRGLFHHGNPAMERVATAR